VIAPTVARSLESPAGESREAHFTYLDGLRGLLALYVLAFHFLGANLEGVTPALARVLAIFQFGHPAVGFFIVLSGYSLSLPVVRSPDRSLRGGFRGYFLRRCRRILPPYYASLLLSIVVVAVVLWIEQPDWRSAFPAELGAPSVLSHLALLHTLVPGQSNLINTALWSIATEWHLYFLFPWVLLPSWRKAGTPTLIVAAFTLGLLPQLLAPDVGGFLRFGCPWYIGLFALGMAAAEMERRETHPLNQPTIIALIFVFAMFLFLGSKRINPGVDPGGRFSVQWVKDAAVGLMAWCLLIWCARARNVRKPSILRRILESKPAVVLGSFSYSLYVTHCAVLTGLNCATLVYHLDPTRALLVRLVVGIPLAIGLAYVFSLAFEKPFLQPRRTARSESSFAAVALSQRESKVPAS
jgi:peptidoglycan/LPS O-acetylase OafA/YrhL